jgi:hypothetical protein
MATEKCTRQPALTAEKNAKFLSSQTAQGQFIAESATQNEDHQEDIKLTAEHLNLVSRYFLFYFFIHFSRLVF